MSESVSPASSHEGTASDLTNRYGPNHELRKRVKDYLIQCCSPCKSWFRSKEIADSLDAQSKTVGLCLRAIERDPQGIVRIVEVRESDRWNRWRVEVNDGE